MSRILNWRGGILANEAKSAVEEALYQSGEIILTQAKDLVPKATGSLEGSGVVERQRDGVIVGFNTPYALEQHENIGLRHPDPTNPLSVSGRQAKYLQVPVDQNRGNIQALVLQAVKGVFP
jgi:hypothetical protein